MPVGTELKLAALFLPPMGWGTRVSPNQHSNAEVWSANGGQ